MFPNANFSEKPATKGLGCDAAQKPGVSTRFYDCKLLNSQVENFVVVLVQVCLSISAGSLYLESMWVVTLVCCPMFIEDLTKLRQLITNFSTFCKTLYNQKYNLDFPAALIFGLVRLLSHFEAPIEEDRQENEALCVALTSRRNFEF